MLEKNADLNFRSMIGRTFLHLATEIEDATTVSLLCEHGGSVIDAQDIDGSTALHLAVRYNSIPIVKLLMQAKANPNILNLRGHTCMHEALLNGNEKLGVWLLYRGAYKNRFTVC